MRYVALLDQEWIVRHPHQRTLRLTDKGAVALHDHLGVELGDPRDIGD
jgi:hypothetical protein